VRATITSPTGASQTGAPASLATGSATAAPVAALRSGDVPTEFRGHLPAGAFAASYNRDEQWHLGVAGRTIDVAARGAPFQRYVVEQGGDATFDYRGSFGHLVLLVFQFFAFCAVIASARRARLRRSDIGPAGDLDDLDGLDGLDELDGEPVDRVDGEPEVVRRESPVGREDDW
jgi:hypothetical protein